MTVFIIALMIMIIQKKENPVNFLLPKFLSSPK